MTTPPAPQQPDRAPGAAPPQQAPQQQAPAPGGAPASGSAPAAAPPSGPAPIRVKRTRVGGVWVASALFAVVLLLLLIFILENGHRVEISFFGAHGHLPLGVALLLAAVLGVLLVVIPGTGRIVQLRILARRHGRAEKRAGAAQPQAGAGQPQTRPAQPQAAPPAGRAQQVPPEQLPPGPGNQNGRPA
jgi:uncharacterized integral membrane protein